MRISERTVLVESAVAGALAAGTAMVLSPADAGLSLGGPHLVWLAVLLISARYGSRGLAFALPLGWGMVSAAAVLLGRVPALLARVDSGADLVALVAAVLVAWVASVHERRYAGASAQLVTMRERAAAAELATREVRDAFASLRARADRLDLSLTFLRDVAARIENGDPATAAGAALELIMTRTGARAGVVQQLPGWEALLPAPGAIGDADDDAGDDEDTGDIAATLAWNGVWSADGAGMVPELSADQTVAAALRSRRPVRAIDLSHGRPSDSDLAAPLLDAAGAPRGVVAVRGVPHAGASLATLHDLGVVATWLSRALARSRSARSEGARQIRGELGIADGDLDVQASSPAVDMPVALLSDNTERA